jgi:hypothetical protein
MALQQETSLEEDDVQKSGCQTRLASLDSNTFSFLRHCRYQIEYFCQVEADLRFTVQNFGEIDYLHVSVMLVQIWLFAYSSSVEVSQSHPPKLSMLLCRLIGPQGG